MTYEQVIAVAKQHKGKVLQTIRGKEFTVDVEPKRLIFTPGTKSPWPSYPKETHRFLDRFNQSRNYAPSAYQDISVNASYYLILIHLAEGQLDDLR